MALSAPPPDDNNNGSNGRDRNVCGLTPRELEVARYLGQDIDYSCIALKLGVGRETIRRHAKNIMEKLHVKSRHAAVHRLIVLGVELYSLPENRKEKP